MTIGAIFIGCFFVSTVSENQVVSGLNSVAYFLAGFVLGIPIAWFFLSAGRIALRIMRHERLVNSGSYTGSTVSYNSNNKWDQERAERERQEREADQRAKARYDARTNQLKAEYDARTAAGWGKQAQNETSVMMRIIGKISKKILTLKIRGCSIENSVPQPLIFV